jgi:hypothetical protein
MRKINFVTNVGNLELEVAPALVEKVAIHNTVNPAEVTDGMILRFFQQASDSAFSKAMSGYISSDGQENA